MPYQPTVNDRSGEILAQGQVNASQTRAQGQIAMTQGIASAIQSIAGGITQGIAKQQETIALDQYTVGTAEALGNISHQDLAAIGVNPSSFQEQIAGTLAIKDPVKRAASLAVTQDMLGKLSTQNKINTQMQGVMMRQQYGTATKMASPQNAPAATADPYAGNPALDFIN